MERSRRTLGVTWLVSGATALSLLGDQALYAVLPTEYERLGLAPFHVGLLLSVNRWIRFLTNSLAAWALERYRVRVLFAISCFVGSLTTFAYALLPAFGWFLLARVVWGLCWSFIRHSGIAEVTASAATGRESRSVGVYNGIARLGSLVGNAVGGLLVDLSGWFWTFLLMALVSLGAVPLAGAAPSRAKRPSPPAPGGRMWRRLVLVASNGWLVGCVAGIVMSSLGALLTERLGAQRSEGALLGLATLNGLLLASRWVLEGVGAPGFGALADRYGRDRLTRCSLIGGGVFLLLLWRPSPLPLLAGAVIGFFAVATALNTILTSEAALRGSASLAAYVTGSDLGAASGPLLAWSLLELGLLPSSVLLIGVLLYGLGLFLSARFFVNPSA
ncbi:MAG: MFS transporter [Candidatus Poribacteria bacterium]|nr:MAG: MFS transporter [Candidatus Poribacteria bacterium]